MKKIIHSIKSSFRRAGLIIGAAVLAAGIQSATAQSIGCHVVTNSVGGIDNAEGDSMLPADSAGVPSLAGSLSGAQTNWNNFSRYGSGTLTLTSSLGTSYNFDLQWDSGFSDTTGTWPNLGTPDGELMDAFMSNTCYVMSSTSFSYVLLPPAALARTHAPSSARCPQA